MFFKSWKLHVEPIKKHVFIVRNWHHHSLWMNFWNLVVLQHIHQQGDSSHASSCIWSRSISSKLILLCSETSCLPLFKNKITVKVLKFKGPWWNWTSCSLLYLINTVPPSTGLHPSKANNRDSFVLSGSFPISDVTCPHVPSLKTNFFL